MWSVLKIPENVYKSKSLPRIINIVCDRDRKKREKKEERETETEIVTWTCSKLF